MCYAFTDKLQTGASRYEVNDSIHHLEKDGTVHSKDEAPLDTTPRKRAATTLLQREPSKATKCSEEGESIATTEESQQITSNQIPAFLNIKAQIKANFPHYTDDQAKGKAIEILQNPFQLTNEPTQKIAEGAEEVASESSGLSDLTDRLSEAKKEIQILKETNVKYKDKANSEFKRLKDLNTDLENERDELRVRAVESEAEVEELQAKLKAKAPGDKGPALALSKKLENEVKAKYDTKLQTLQTKHDEKLQKCKETNQQALKKKDEKHQEKIDELKDKQQEKLDELRDRDQKREEEWKTFKAEHQKLQKQLKTEQQEKIKEAKPETNKALKEREKEVTQLRQVVDRLSKTQATLKNINERLEAEKRDLETKNLDLENMVHRRTEFIEDQYKKQTEMEFKYQDKLNHEGDRFQLQYDRAEDLAKRLVQQQRNDFVFRNSHNQAIKRKEELEKELHVAREQIEKLKGGVSHIPGELDRAEYEEKATNEGDDIKILGDTSAPDAAVTNTTSTASIESAESSKEVGFMG